MELYRICSAVHSKTLTSSGVPNRWNKKGEYVIYTAESRSLATLEMIVHRNSIKSESSYKVLTISVIESNNLINEIVYIDLPKSWRSFETYSKLQQIGSEWYNSNASLLLKIPSAIIPKEFNYVINSQHPDFKKKVSLVESEDYFWDERLL